ncbi:MAG: carboxypeptidase regulatory-like domain-containing protein [Pirellulales bacterium]|nr:carboxypeptidase regulatory-like domain-containing protein [Pirellulales bacterium]
MHRDLRCQTSFFASRARRAGRTLLLLAVLTGMTGVSRAEGNVASTITFVLDCSAPMSEPANVATSAGDVKGAVTMRFDAAREALIAMLNQLAEEGNHEASVILFGHRLAWDGTDEPQLMEQTGYLEQTLGFGALAGLMPGDDVEVIRPLGPFGLAELATITERLNVAQPWGESPLYYALVKAMDGFSGRRNSSQAGIVVLTDGRNKQWLARNRWGRDNLGKLIESSPVPIHIVSYGASPQGSGTSETELRELVTLSGGTFKAAERADVLVAQLENVFITSNRSESVASPASEQLSAATGGTAIAGVPAAAPPVSTAAQRNTIQGRVMMYKNPVRGAVVMLSGADVPQVQTDREGHFTLRGVAPGQYKLEIDATYKNITYHTQQAVSVEPAPNHGPTVEIRLEQRR